ncbi:uncharacterized protein si:dkey-61p9.7 isoform X3 [Alosa alosa]|uniref:uncharacterized protein si:dkey-61p9.7 isoform X3 n=1 Tax=Alosa alosa TaxID=278164 RepID=UPI002015076D|nr:uncharacterized protein si:dkey-61p9.7 isoform X3 [Alosa alosa]
MATNQQKVPRRCQCGWSNVTTYQGLRTHQGKAKCEGYGEAFTPSAFLTTPSQNRTSHNSHIEPSMVHKRHGEPASLRHLQQTYGISGISLEDEPQQGTLSRDWTRRDRGQWPMGKETSVTTAQPLRSVLELRREMYSEERAQGHIDPTAALKVMTSSDELETLKKENEHLKTRFEDYKAANDELEMLKKDNEHLKTRFEDYKAANEKLTATMKALEKQNGDLKIRESLTTKTETLKKENENFRVQACLAKTAQVKEPGRNLKQAQHPCRTCGHYITHMYNEFLANKPEQAYTTPCQQCDDGFVQLYHHYLKAKQLENDYKPPCVKCKEEYTNLCSENFYMRSSETDVHQSCQDCGHNFKQLAKILQIPTENRPIHERTKAKTSFEDTNDSCSETELREELNQLKQKEFPKALKSITSQKNSLEGKTLKVKMQWTFDIAKRDTTKKQEELQHIFPDKTPGHLQLAFSNLQTALYNCSESHHRRMIQEFIKDEQKDVSALLVKWYRLSCLMVLHNPPLLPKWDTDGLPCSLDQVQCEKAHEDTASEEKKGCHVAVKSYSS